MEEKNEVITMRFYPEDSDAFLRALKDSDLPVLEVHTEQEELKDYNALTKQYFRPIRIEGLTILPPWSKRKPIGPSLVIEPGMAFGTGRHESTRLMIKIMRSLDFKGATVLDLGCGSGILSLYAALLGAKTVVAVDNDLDTVLNARKNVTLNEARDIELVCADLTHVRGSYDVVLANLDIRTFTAHVPIVTAFTRPASKIVVSGILGRDRMKLISLFKPLELIRIEQKNSWRGFLFEVNSE
jgi:ribosomal protein L11 methyltransferase